MTFDVDDDYLCPYCCEDLDDCLTEPCEERIAWYRAEYEGRWR